MNKIVLFISIHVFQDFAIDCILKALVVTSMSAIAFEASRWAFYSVLLFFVLYK